MNDESCELKQKKKSAGMKMDALVGFGGGSGRRANYNPEKSIFIFDRELALAVLYVCFRLVLLVVLLPFLNLQAQIGNIFHFLIGIFSFL